MNVVCYERSLLWTGLLWMGLLWTWSVLSGLLWMVCFERVCFERTPFEIALGAASAIHLYVLQWKEGRLERHYVGLGIRLFGCEVGYFEHSIAVCDLRRVHKYVLVLHAVFVHWHMTGTALCFAYRRFVSRNCTEKQKIIYKECWSNYQILNVFSIIGGTKPACVSAAFHGKECMNTSWRESL